MKRIVLCINSKKIWKANFFFFFLATPLGMRDLSSLTRDQTGIPLQWKHEVLTTGLPGKSLEGTNLNDLQVYPTPPSTFRNYIEALEWEVD